jgi:cytochrome c biogenesis protein CcdA
MRIYFFYSEGCDACMSIKNNYFPKILPKYSPLVEIEFVEISDLDNYKFMTEVEEKYGMLKNPPPAMLVGDKILDGEKEIKEHLEETIELLLAKPKTEPQKKPVEKKEESPGSHIGLIEKFKYLGVGTIIGAGLIDGINPCAFSTIIIFVLYLTFSAYKRGLILKVGIIFALAVFLAYLLIGLGLLEFVRQLRFLPTLRRAILLFSGIVAFVLGFLSLYDLYKIKKGKLKEITLQLPNTIKDAIKKLIWKKSKKEHYLISAFVIGILVGVLEFPCTGQVYFPIVLALRHVPSLHIHAFGYLLLYNLMFIIPLLLVFAFVYWGATSDGLIRFMKKRSGIVKILTAILFFTLGAILIFFGIE